MRSSEDVLHTSWMIPPAPCCCILALPLAYNMRSFSKITQLSHTCLDYKTERSRGTRAQCESESRYCRFPAISLVDKAAMRLA